MAEVIFSEDTLLDVESIAKFIERDSAKFAGIQVKNFDAIAEKLQEFPRLGRIVPKVGHTSIRELISGNYRLIYWLQTKSKVIIICVFHSARKLKKGFIHHRKKHI